MSDGFALTPRSQAVARVPGEQVRALREGWELLSLPAGRASAPAELADAGPWRAAPVPGTVAQAWDPALGALSEADTYDHWYRCRFAGPAGEFTLQALCFEGLATVADVWLNGALLLHSESMFLPQAVCVDGALGEENELWIRFHALRPWLEARRPRGRWPTRLVPHKHLRFVRTTFLGHMPGWCPSVPAVGPWRAIRWVGQRGLGLERVRLLAGWSEGRGRVEVELVCRSAAPLGAARVRVGEVEGPLAVVAEPDGRWRVSGSLVVEGAEPWWPHTHGAPRRYAAALVLGEGDAARSVELGQVGFRALEREREGGAFTLRVNGEPVFCRGACWTPLRLDALHASEADYAATLGLVRDAGINMLRVSGVMTYESDVFYRLCDELGILVWQDFMFANLDYPTDDAFRASCRGEVAAWLERTGQRACVAVLCGNSEVQQQAAMMGVPREQWAHPLFDEDFPELCARLRPDVPYVPSSPCEGAMPFHCDAGPAHYFGVGAYLRGYEDAWLAGVRFASECLGFSNVPEPEGLALLGDAGAAAPHHPDFKAGVPRDPGTGWDFADVTDRYLERVFEVEAAPLRYRDPQRYFALSRATSAEVMATVQGIWRRAGSPCGGSLIWLLRDPRPGAGWGLLDSAGEPKAPYYALKRAWAPRAVWLVDEGLNGVSVQVCNEAPRPARAELTLALLRPDGATVARVERTLELEPRAQWAQRVEALLGAFADSSDAYRFGPRAHAVVAAQVAFHELEGAAPAEVSRAFLAPPALANALRSDLGVRAEARALPDGAYLVTASAEGVAHAVAVRAKGYRPSDNYFHLAPGFPVSFRLDPLGAPRTLRAKLEPLNASAAAPIRLCAEEADA